MIAPVLTDPVPVPPNSRQEPGEEPGEEPG